MALNNEKDLLKLKALLVEVNALRKQFGEGALDVDFARASAATMEDLLQMQKKYKSTLSEINDSWGAVSNILKDIKTEFGKTTDGMKVALNSFNRLQSISNQFANDALGIQKMSKREIQNNITSIQKEIKIQQEALKLLEEKQARGEELTENEQKMVAELKSENIQNNIALNTAKSRLQKEKDIQKTLGLSGAIIKGIQGSLAKIGIDSSYFEGVAEKMEQAAESGSKWKTAMVGLGGIAKGIGEALSDPLVIITMMYKTIKFLIGAVSEFSKGVSNVGKSFGIAGKQAEETYKTIAKSQDLYHFPDELIEGQKKYNEAVGFNLAYNKENAALMQDLTHYLGLSEEQAGKLVRRSRILGQDFKSMDKDMVGVTNNFNKQNKTAVPYAKVAEQISKVSASTAFNIKGGAKGLAEAAVVAARYGREIDDINNSAKQLLNFEESISNEIEAELLTGKDLNLEKLRYAALTGDTVTQAKEQERLVKENFKSLKGNVLAQEAFAKSIGMTTEDVAKMVEQQEIEADIRKKSGEKGVQAYQASLEAQAKQAKEAEATDRAFKSAIMQLKTALLPLIQKITPFFITMAESMASIGKILSGGVGKTLLAIIGGAGALYAGGKIVKGIGGLFGGGLGMGKGEMVGGDKPGTAKTGFLGKVLGLGGGKIGESAKNPMYVYVVNQGAGGGGGIGGDLLEGASNVLGKRNSFGLKSFKGLSKLFGGKNTMVGRGFRNIAAMMGKRTGFGTQMLNGFSKSSIGSALGFGGSQAAAGTAEAAASGGNILSKTWSGVKGITGKVGTAISKSLGGVKSILGSPIAKGFGKALGPIFAAISSISSVSSIISEARDQKAKGQKVDKGSLGKRIVQAGAYPIANLATNLIPGIGPAISIADGILGAFNMSPIKWITDNLVDLVPNEAFTGLGKLALGEKEKAMATGGIVTGPTRALVGEAGPEAVIPLNQLMNEFKEMKQILNAILHKEGTIVLNGTKMGTAMAVGSYKVQ